MYAVVVVAMTLVYIFNGALYEGLFRKIVSTASLFTRYNNFSYGVFDIGTVVYYVSFGAFFLYLTYQALEKKRWS